MQGVFYRATVAHRARALAIAGHAHNLADGRVEVLACGEPQALAEFERWLWIGSSASKVTSVVAEEAAPGEGAVPGSFVTG